MAPLAEACNLLLPHISSSREKHTDAAKESSDKAVTSRTSKFRHDHFAFYKLSKTLLILSKTSLLGQFVSSCCRA
jgi:hypothetical protein